MSSKEDVEIVPITDDLDRYGSHLSAARGLHRSFRPKLPEDYDAYMRQVFGDGAEMAVLTVAGITRSLAVYRSFRTTSRGLRFYVDDLVTDEAHRGAGYGGKLLDWCEARARERGCDVLDLESGLHRPRTHKFYFRQGLTIFAFSFSKPLR
jgi:GNAT superfamily N-acetyltransferase